MSTHPVSSRAIAPFRLPTEHLLRLSDAELARYVMGQPYNTSSKRAALRELDLRQRRSAFAQCAESTPDAQLAAPDALTDATSRPRRGAPPPRAVDIAWLGALLALLAIGLQIVDWSLTA